MANDVSVQTDDVKTLRTLASRIRALAASPENQERRENWYRNNSLIPGRPMVIAELGGLRQNSELPTESMLRCAEPWARDLERSWRTAIYAFEVIRDDWVIEPFINCNWHVNPGDYGVHAEHHSGSKGGKLGSYVWEPPLKNLQGDLANLKKRNFSVDRERTLACKKQLEDLFGDILPVRIRGSFWWTMGITATAINLVGLEQLMLYMIDDPEGLHRLMQFLHDDHVAFAEWLEREGLLSLNNENDYVGSGSVGYTRELPRPGMTGTVRMQDTWCLSESQETVGVGPDMFAEFIFPYQKSLIERFGLCYYGCCEPVHSRWHVIRQIANLRKVSVSPWCDERIMARELAGKYVYCRKPNPTLVSTEHFDEEAIRADLRRTIELTSAAGCNTELVMKDVHTVQNQPLRLSRWTQIAREEIARVRTRH